MTRFGRTFLPLIWLGGIVALQAVAQAQAIDGPTRKRCLRILQHAIESDEFWPAMHAAEAMTLAGEGRQVRERLGPKLLETTDDQMRCGLARELVRAGDTEKRSVMIKILEGADPHGHVHAAESLYKVGPQDGAEVLLDVFRRTQEGPLKLMAAAALAKHAVGSTRGEALEFLRSVASDASDPGTFRIAVWVLARVGTPEDISLIQSRIKDADDELTLAFLHHALAALGDPSGRAALLNNFDSTNPAIRTYAAVFAGESGIKQAVPKLLLQLDDAHLDARVRAAQALLLMDQSPDSHAAGRTAN